MARPARTLSPGELAKLEQDAHRLDDVPDLLKYLDVSRSTFNRWMKYGREHPDDHGDFRREFWRIVMNARLGSKRTLLGVVTDLAVNGETEATRLSAAKFLLDRVHKLAQHVAVQNPDGSAIGASTSGPTADDLAKLSTEDLRRYHAAQAVVLELGARAVEGEGDPDDAAADA